MARDKQDLKRAQQRADLALPLASKMSQADRKTRRGKALASQTTAKARARKKLDPTSVVREGETRKKAKPKAKRVRTVFGVAERLKGLGKLE